MKRNTWSLAGELAALVAMLAWVGGCQTSNMWAGEYDDPKSEISIEPGQTFTIALPSDKASGYAWRLAQQPDEKYVKLISTRYENPETTLARTGGREIWIFQAVSKGKSTINMEYARPQGTGEPASKTAQFNVKVY